MARNLASAYGAQKQAKKKKAPKSEMSGLKDAVEANTAVISKSRNSSGLKIHPFDRDMKASGGTVESGSRDMNYADGGQVTNASKMTSENASKKELYDSNWTDRPDKKQSQGAGMKTTRIKHSKMVASDKLQVRLRDEEDDLQNSAAPGNPDKQPSKSMNEEDAMKMGSDPDMSKPHSGPKSYAKGGEVKDKLGQPVRQHLINKVHASMKKAGIESDYASPNTVADHARNIGVNLKSHEVVHGSDTYAKGGKVESSDYDDTDPNASTDSDMHDTPSEDEGDETAKHHNEEYQRQTSSNPDDSMPHSDDIDTYMYADGGDVPQPEADEEEHDSIAAAVMARRERLHAAIDSGAADLNQAARMAEGGEADLEMNAKEQPNEYPPHNGEALDWDKDAEYLDMYQPEDSNEQGHDIESDSHDMIDSIRRKIRAKKQLSEA